MTNFPLPGNNSPLQTFLEFLNPSTGHKLTKVCTVGQEKSVIINQNRNILLYFKQTRQRSRLHYLCSYYCSQKFELCASLNQLLSTSSSITV